MIVVKEEEIEDTIWIVRIRKSKYRQHIHQKTRSKEQTKHPPKDRGKSTDNTSTKRQGQKNKKASIKKTGAKVQTTHPPKDRVKSTHNISTKRQGQQYRQNIHQKKG
jgi:phosphatidylinositol kinase/protein kinase (PI-3  family)